MAAGPMQREDPAFRMARETGTVGADPDAASLIEAIARHRDREAFTTLFRHFAPRVKTLMLRIGASNARADELAQETMLAVWRKAHLFDPAGASASGWIYKIGRNLRIDGLRRDNRESSTPYDPLGEQEDAPQPDRILAQQDLESRVRRAVAQLSQEQIRVITLSYFEDKPHAEIAASLNLPLGTVKSRLRLATKRLRDLLGDPT
jgi:RNA polymerase sigma-70 factor (ECF subfamily)